MTFQERVEGFRRRYHKLKENEQYASDRAMPGQVYFIENEDILAMPRADGDCRYPLGENGFNYWVYASGYMHSNEGLFSPYLRASEGQEPKIAFFAGFANEQGNYDVVPILAVPVMNIEESVERYTIFTKGSAYYIAEMRGMTFTIRTFVDSERKSYYTVSVINHTNEVKSFFISSYFNPFLKNAVMECAENRWFRQGTIIKPIEGQNLQNCLIEVYEERERGAMAPNYGVFNRRITKQEGLEHFVSEVTTSRNDYVGGTRSSLHTPAALYRGSFKGAKAITTFTEVAVAADIIHCELQAKGRVRVDTVMTCTLEEDRMEALLKEIIDDKVIDQLEQCILEKEVEKQEGLKLTLGEQSEGKIKPNVFNAFFEHLKKQVEFCSMIKGYIQLSDFSLIGIRDVYQALEGLVFWQPEAARNKLLEGLNFIQPDGRCPRQYSLPRFEGDIPRMDLRPFIDQGIWVISTITTYLRLTHDFEFLNEKCGYYEFVNDKAHVAKKLDQESTVLQHLIEIMDYLLKNRDHEYTQCICALYGDWNDALDGLGVSKDKKKAYGTGVSIMATLQVYQNCLEMIELLEWVDRDKYMRLIEEYTRTRKELEKALMTYGVVKDEQGNKRILHGWGDERSYLVGSFHDPDGMARDGITSNAFWVLSGMYDQHKEMKDTLLGAYERLDSKYGLKTFEPHFEKGTFGVGRIPNLPKGTAENGAAYIHASMFGIMSLFRMGEGKRAWEQLEKSLPFTHEKVSVSPYVMPNSYGDNEEKEIDGESMQDWQTGSSNVMLKTIIRFVVGIEPQYEGVWIQPSKEIPFKDFEFECTIRGTQIALQYEKLGKESRVFIVNGIETKGVYDEIMQLEKLWLDNNFIKNSKKITIQILD
ncbi:MAG: GH36-type glycosyl hydrolase domain-containing protein [Cellulosilyticaceae bacterium]